MKARIDKISFLVGYLFVTVIALIFEFLLTVIIVDTRVDECLERLFADPCLN